MLEYRVVYYTDSVGTGIGSAHDPFVVYQDLDYEDARSAYDALSELVSPDGDIKSVQLQTREVCAWTTARKTERNAQRDSAVR